MGHPEGMVRVAGLVCKVGKLSGTGKVEVALDTGRGYTEAAAGRVAGVDILDRVGKVDRPSAEVAVGKAAALGTELVTDRVGKVAEVGSMVVDTEVDKDMVHRVAEAGILVAAGIRDTSGPLDTWAQVAQEVVGKVQDTWAAWVPWAVVAASVALGSWGTWGVSVVSEAEDTFGSISSVVEVSLEAWGTGLGKAVGRVAVGWAFGVLRPFATARWAGWDTLLERQTRLLSLVGLSTGSALLILLVPRLRCKFRRRARWLSSSLTHQRRTTTKVPPLLLPQVSRQFLRQGNDFW